MHFFLGILRVNTFCASDNKFADNLANSLDPDQARHFVGPVLDASCLALVVILERSLLKSLFKKIHRGHKKRAE